MGRRAGDDLDHEASVGGEGGVKHGRRGGGIGGEQPDVGQRPADALVIPRAGCGGAEIKPFAVPALDGIGGAAGIGPLAGDRRGERQAQGGGAVAGKFLRAARGLGRLDHAVGVPVPECGEIERFEGDHAINDEPALVAEVEQEPAPVGGSRAGGRGKRRVAVSEFDAVAHEPASGGIGAGYLLRTLRGTFAFEEQDVVAGGAGEVIAPRAGFVSVASVVHEEVAGAEGDREVQEIGVIVIGAARAEIEERPGGAAGLRAAENGLAGVGEPATRAVGGEQGGNVGGAEEVEGAAGVGVVVQREGAVGFHHRGEVAEEQVHPGLPGGGEFGAAGGGEERGQVKVGGGDDALVKGGELLVRAVGVNLGVELLAQAAQAVVEPFGGFRGGREHEAELREGEHLGDDVVAVEGVVVAELFAVGVEAGEEPGAALGGERGVGAEFEIDERPAVEDAAGGFERPPRGGKRKVAGRGVLDDPVVERGKNEAGVTVIAGDQVGLAERGEIIVAVKKPRPFDVVARAAVVPIKAAAFGRGASTGGALDALEGERVLKREVGGAQRGLGRRRQ